MAQAQVAITAVDRTQSAINSVSRGFQRLESGAAKLQSRFNLAFSVITGGFVINGFNRLAAAAAKTEAGSESFAQSLDAVRSSANRLFSPREGIGGATEAMRELNKVLNDPEIYRGINAIVNGMLIGFTKAATAIAKVAGLIRKIQIGLGLSAPESAEEIAAVIRKQITEAEMSGGPLGVPNAARDARVTALKQQLKLVEELADAEQKASDDRFNAAEEYARLLSSLKEVSIESSKITYDNLSEFLQKFDDDTKTSIQKQVSSYLEFVSKVDTLLNAGAISVEEANKRTAEALENILSEVEIKSKKVSEVVKQDTDQISIFAEEAAKNMQSAFADFLFDPFQNGLKGMLKGFVDTIRRMVAEFAASQLLKFFFDPFTSSGGFLGTFAKFATGQKAMGGSVLGNKPYIVGERGPELFVPGSNGSIVPNDRMGGTTIAPVYNIDARGATADLQKALPGILQENNRRIFDELDRRYGIGR